MSLDIRFIERKDIICPHCNQVVKTEDVQVVDSGGRAWYPILEYFGYYTEDNTWYERDLVLTTEQAKELYRQIKMNVFELYNAGHVMTLIAQAMMDKNQVVINADW